MNNRFAELGLNEQILAGVDALGFIEPTPVQEQSIPLVLAGRDLVASAQTGTGKTAAFVLPTLQLIAEVAAKEGRSETADVSAESALAEDTAHVESVAAVNDAPADPMLAGGRAPAAETQDEASTDGNTRRRRRRRRRKGKVVAQEVEGSSAPRVSASPTEGSSAARTSTTSVDGSLTPHRSAPLADGSSASRTSTPPADGSSASHTSAPLADGSSMTRTATSSVDGPSAPRTAVPLAEGERADANGSPISDGTQTSNGTPTSDGTSAPGTASASPAGRPSRRRRRRRRGKAEAPATERVQAPKTPTAPLALVITPTRELAQQIERVTTVVCEHTGQRSVIVMGGACFDRQLRDLQRGCDLLVATPGRLIDLMERRIVDLSRIRVLVLDEADRMLDMGFWPSVRRILQALPPKRQNLLFSATIPPSIKGTVDAMLDNPATVEIARIGQTADTVEEHLMPVTQGQKLRLLEELIRTGGAEPGSVLERVLVFCRTKRRVDDVSKSLKASGLEVEVMHADRRQEAREKALRRFREGAVQLLVATDVMSRGIDVSGIDAVVNFDVPMDPEDYVHRIGRTGRAGATGHAYTFMAPDEVTPLREIEYFTKKLVPTWDLPGFEYDSGRIMPQASRTTTKPTRTMFAGSRQRGRGPSGGRYGRHY